MGIVNNQLDKYGYCKNCYGLFPITFLTAISIVENIVTQMLTVSHINYQSESGSYLCNDCKDKINKKIKRD